MRPWIVVSCVLAAAQGIAVPASARQWIVEPSAPNGFTIQAAVDAASPGDTVLLRPGTYTWSSQNPAEHSMVVMAPGITVLGEAGPASTILDGEGMGRLILGWNCGNETQIVGLTIQNAVGPVDRTPPYVNANGAGVRYDEFSTLRMQHCVVRDNRLAHNSQAAAGVFCWRGIILDTEFADNVGTYDSQGIGIASIESLFLQRCTIRGHKALADSGAHGAGVYAYGTATIIDCVFEANEAVGSRSSYGAALSIRLGGSIEGSRFAGNHVETSSGWQGAALGGAIATQEGNLTITDCVFVGNTATSAGYPGVGGAVSTTSRDAILEVTGCTFIGNRSLANGPVLPDAPAVACVYGPPGQLRVTNSIFAWNEGQPLLDGTDASCCDFFGNTRASVVPDAQNIELDPLFCSLEYTSMSDFTLRANSPCRAGGTGSCGLIGAADVGCEALSVEHRSWGEIKQLFR